MCSENTRRSSTKVAIACSCKRSPRSRPCSNMTTLRWLRVHTCVRNTAHLGNQFPLNSSMRGTLYGHFWSIVVCFLSLSVPFLVVHSIGILAERREACSYKANQMALQTTESTLGSVTKAKVRTQQCFPQRCDPGAPERRLRAGAQAPGGHQLKFPRPPTEA